jgi:hypothetical protein
LTVDFNANDRLQVGFEYNFLVQELGFRGTYVLSSETASRPMIHLNTSSDRIGTPEGYQQVSLTVAKNISGTPFAPYVSLTYSGFEKGFVVPFGINIQFGRTWNLLAMNDGRKSHLLLNHSFADFYVQVGLIWLREPSVTVGWGF